MKLRYQVNEVPKSKLEFVFLGIQHVFAMFGSTVIVPLLVGINPSIAILTAGVGTLVYGFITQSKVPVFIGSSFAYISLLAQLNETQGANAVALAVMVVGVCYMLISLIIAIVGVRWLDYILPPVVMGSLIVVIGLSLAPTAMANSGLTVETFNYKSIVIALITLIATLIALEKGNNFVKSIPILIGIIVGYITAIIFGVVDFTIFENMKLFSLPAFNTANLFNGFEFDSTILLAVIPLVIVTVSEHIGDHTISSTITEKDFLKDPGLKRTLLGDGVASFVAGILGGPVNTTYAENTGVIILTRVASVRVIQLAAVFAIGIAFINPISLFISSIPIPVMGGISITLFGLIAQNGIRILMSSNIDFNHTRNMIIVATILVVGLGGGYFGFSLFNVDFAFQGMSLAAIFGIAIHLLLPDKHLSLKSDKEQPNELVDSTNKKG